MTKVIIFGASGQLGQCFKKITQNDNLDYLIFPAEDEANILDVAGLEKVFAKYTPTHAVNCAAYTAVDKAEDDIEAAVKVNKTGVENIARLCKQYDTTFVQVSTDFVFKGDKASPLTEEDVTEPIGVYGQTKLDGELVIPGLTDKYFILRTAWLYSEFANNFAKTMLKLGAERDLLKIIADQVGTPTYAMDLAAAILTVINSGNTEYGVYHYSNEGVASWYDFTKAIFDVAGVGTKVLPITTSEYPTRAVRPAYSVMDKSKFKKTFDTEVPYWRESLKVCISRLKNN